MLTIPLVCQEVLGQSVLARTIGCLQAGGINDICVIADGYSIPSAGNLLRQYRSVRIVEGRADRWFAKYNKQVAQSGETTLVARVGGYLEFNPAELLAFHREKNHSVTRAHSKSGPLDLWAVTRPADRQQELNLFWLMHSARSAAYELTGYVKELDKPGDLRQLAVDVLSGHCSARPEGKEIRPGVWVASGARIHPRARIVAPAYIGRESAVGAYAAITRCSNLEHHCEVGAGTYIAASSIFSNTRIGRGLFVSDSVVDGSGLLHLRRNVMVKLTDGRLLGRTLASPEGSVPKEEAKAQGPRVIQIKPQPRAVVAESCAMGLLEDEG